MNAQDKYGQWLAKFNALPLYTQKIISESLLGKSLELYLDPTGKCNFRCDYCYESFSIGRMSRKLVESVKLFILDKMINRKTLYLNWFGGEPLTAFPVVEDITAWANKFCANSKLNFFSSITTNGYNLDGVTSKKLIDMGISVFQITLDGPRDAHDSIRKLANGKPTFDRIWSNLLKMRELDENFTTIIRIHARKDNASRIKELLDDIENSFCNDDRFVIGLRPLENLGGNGIHSIELLEHDQFIHLKEHLERSANSKVKDLMKDEIPLPGQESTQNNAVQKICYACKPNSFHIRADGSVGKCTVALDKDYNYIGHLDDSGKIKIDSHKMSLWTRGMLSLDRQEMECPLSTLDSHPSVIHAPA